MSQSRPTFSLLFWHWLALSWCCGIWATRHPLSAGILFSLLTFWHCSSLLPLSEKVTGSTAASPQLLEHFPAGAQYTFAAKRTLIAICLHILLFSGGFLQTCAYIASPPVTIPDFIEQRTPVTYSGTIREVIPGMDHQYKIILDDVKIQRDDKEDNQELAGSLVLTWRHPPHPPAPWQQLSTTTRIKPVHGFKNTGCWDTQAYWRDKGVFWRAWTNGSKTPVVLTGDPTLLWSLRDTLQTRSKIALSISKDRFAPLIEALDIIPALLFGDRTLLSSSRFFQLSIASLSHSLALSGMHLGLMVLFAHILAYGIGRVKHTIFLSIPRQKLTILLAAPLVTSYVWLGGYSPSLVRAGLMFACWGTLIWLNRPRVLLDGLFFAIACILLSSPLALFDIRLQLSALAVLSLILFMPSISAIKPRSLEMPPSFWNRQLRNCLGILAASFCIQLVLLPVTVWNFNTASPWFFLNLLWLPVISGVVLPLSFLGLLLCILGMSLPASTVFILAAYPIDILFTFLDWLQQTHLLTPVIAIRPHWLAIFGFGLLLASCAIWIHQRRNPSYLTMLRRVWLLLGIILLTTPVIVRLAATSNSSPSLTALDVGQGQSILLQIPVQNVKQDSSTFLSRLTQMFPASARILVDGGGFSSRSFDVGRAILTPALTRNQPPRLDLIANTHPDTDHLRGLFFPLAEFDIKESGGNGVLPTGWNLKMLKAALSHNSRETLSPTMIRGWQTWQAGDNIPFGDKYMLQVLHPPRNYEAHNTNDAALVLRLTDITTSPPRGLALLTGDIEENGILHLLRQDIPLSAQVLILPHHGSAGSLVQEFYDRVSPDIAIASCGFLNRWNFPAPRVVDALRIRQIPLFTTAEHGQIKVLWKNDKISVVDAKENQIYISPTH